MSVVGPDFEELKQYNLAEIYDPTPKPNAEKSKPPPNTSAGENDLPSAPIVGKREPTLTPTPTSDDRTNNDATLGDLDVQIKDDGPDESIPNNLASEDKEAALSPLNEV